MKTKIEEAKRNLLEFVGNIKKTKGLELKLDKSIENLSQTFSLTIEDNPRNIRMWHTYVLDGSSKDIRVRIGLANEEKVCVGSLSMGDFKLEEVHALSDIVKYVEKYCDDNDFLFDRQSARI